MWSLGCITLEFVIWVLYGNTVLEEFHTQVEAGRKQTCQYFELHEDRKDAEVHPTVLKWMKRIRMSDPECSQNTAIADLLDIISNRLLVVKLGPGSTTRHDLPRASKFSGKSTSGFRATAAEYRYSLEVILEKAKKSPDYLFSGKSRDAIRLPERTDFLSVATSQQRNLSLNQRSHDTNTERSFGITGRSPRLEYSVSTKLSSLGNFPLCLIDSMPLLPVIDRCGSKQAPDQEECVLLARYVSDRRSTLYRYVYGTSLTKFPSSASTGMIDFKLPYKARTEISKLRDWEYPVDNVFVERYQSSVGALVPHRSNHGPATLCQRCAGFDFWTGGFTFTETMSTLSKSAATCTLCSLLDSACKRDGLMEHEDIQVERRQSNLKLSNAKLPILSILRSAGRSSKIHCSLQFIRLHRAAVVLLNTVVDTDRLGRPYNTHPNTDRLPNSASAWLRHVFRTHQVLAPRL